MGPQGGWEYRVRDLGVEYSAEGEWLWEEYLNALGAEGWQLVSNTPLRRLADEAGLPEVEQAARLVFMRPAQRP